MFQIVPPKSARVAVAVALAPLLLLLPFPAPAHADPPVFTVTSTADPGSAGFCDQSPGGECTLRNAIISANSAGISTIKFNINAATDLGCNAATGVCTIQPKSALPFIIGGITIDGFSQSGATPNSNAVNDPAGPGFKSINAALKIELDGSKAGPGVSGLVILGGASTIQGLVINRFASKGGAGGPSATCPNGSIGGHGIEFTTNVKLNVDTGGSFVFGNFIGTDVTGTKALGNSCNGVMVWSGAPANVIGGSIPDRRNVISGNGLAGILITAAATTANQNFIYGNFIGTNAAGSAALGNTLAGVLASTADNIVGTGGAGNLISGNGYYGLALSNPEATGNTVGGNLIGTDASGTKALGNGQIGVSLANKASANTIGGTSTGKRNVISGNGVYGIELNIVHGNTVQGNYVGTDATGTKAVGNGCGPSIIGCAGIDVASDTSVSPQGDGNTIGGSAPGAGNLISGNQGNGVSISGSASNTVVGNYVGTDYKGTSALGNAAYGVLLQFGSHDNAIGGALPGTGNVIAFNGFAGVLVGAYGNYGGTTHNRISRNPIFSNGQLGIDLTNVFPSGGVTPNDLGDPDSGANDLQNFPVLAPLASKVVNGKYNSTAIKVSLNSTPTANFDVELFVNAACDPSGHGQGQTSLGLVPATTLGDGNVTFTYNLANPVPEGQFLTATATNQANGSTSEFSTCLPTGAIVVNSTADPGTGICDAEECTLREAILAANQNSDPQAASKIAFAIPKSDPGCNAAGVCTIKPSSPLPSATTPVVIDGYTQPGAKVNTNQIGQGSNAALKIELDGTSAGMPSDKGLLTIAGGSSVVRGLVINRSGGSGIQLASVGNTVAGNSFGTDVTGTKALGNSGSGVLVSSGTNNTIGGSNAPDRNLLSANKQYGVEMLAPATATSVSGNLIGTAADGVQALGNALAGVHSSAAKNTIGGLGVTPATCDGSCNVIAFNGAGVLVDGAGSANSILGNVISSNTGLGIDLGGDGVTTGGAYPVPLLSFVTVGGKVGGTAVGAANGTVRLEFFSNSACDAPSGYGEGQHFLGFMDNVTLDGAGHKDFETNGFSIPKGDTVVTATATAMAGGTSEFSACQQVGVITVNSASDPGADTFCGGIECTLRHALAVSNSEPGQETVAFTIPGACTAGSPHTIKLIGELTITDPVTIDGYTDKDAKPNTLADGDNAVLCIELSGAGVPYGLHLSVGGSGSTVKGLAINQFTHQVLLDGSAGNHIEGNFIGTDVTGTVALMTNSNSGVYVSVASNANTIGGTTPAARNLISGVINGSGIIIVQSSNKNVVQGNYIGTDRNGAAALPNSDKGVLINNSAGNTIGGTSPAARNVISGNGGEGVYILNSGATGNVVQGNFIGTDVSGAAPIPNKQGGVRLLNSASNNTIGGKGVAAGACDGPCNVIAFNGSGAQPGQAGMVVESGTGNAILGNAISANVGLGIDLQVGTNSGVTANDLGDPDTGANNLQNFPVLFSAAALSNGSTLVKGTLNSTASGTFRLEFFANGACDPSGYGQGQTFLGATTVITDASGDAKFGVTLSPTVPAGQFVAATATDDPGGNTSEFSACAAILADADGDGIVDNVDPASNDPANNSFSDAGFGGATTGTIVRGDRDWLITHDPSGGVKIVVGPGGLAAQFTGTGVCNLSNVTDVPPAGGTFHLLCGSITVKVEAGSATETVTAAGAVIRVQLGAGGGVTFKLTGAGAVQVTNAGTIPLSGTIDGAPFSLAAGASQTIIPDTTPPVTSATLSPGPDAGGWNRTDVSVRLTAVDNPGPGAAAVSGVKEVHYRIDGGQQVVTPGASVSVTLGTEGIHTLSYFAVDKAGNQETAKSLTVKIDKTAPTITIGTPVNAVYLLNQVVKASYSCADSGSGVATCAGPVASGAGLDTSSVGTKTFTVNAKDAAGNASSQTVSYIVAYNVCAARDDDEDDQGKIAAPAGGTHEAGSTVVLSMRLCDAQGRTVSARGIAVTATGLTPGALPPNGFNEGRLGTQFAFRGDEDGAAYAYKLKTKGLAPGTYTLSFAAVGDPTVHTIQFTLRAPRGGDDKTEQAGKDKQQS